MNTIARVVAVLLAFFGMSGAPLTGQRPPEGDPASRAPQGSNPIARPRSVELPQLHGGTPAGKAADSLVRHVQSTLPLAAVSALVIRGRDTLLARGYGLADRGRRTAATPRTRYHFGSVGKQFTAAALMQLVERGKVSLDDPITRYVPEYPEGAGRTLRHLLAMQSGIPNYTKDVAVRSDSTLTDAEVVAAIQRQRLVFEPGTRFQYSNSNYHLLGMVVARVSGRAFREYLQNEVIRRAGTDELYACAAPPEPGRARPYALVNDSLVAAPLPVDYGWGAGSVCGSVRGLAAWATALADGRVVSRDSYAQMTTPGRTASGAATPYGFGLYVDTVAGHPVVWHGGLLPAYEAYVARYPRDGLVVALATNTISASGEMPYMIPLAGAIAEHALGVSAALRLSVADRNRLVGSYRIGERVVRISASGSGLNAAVAGQAPFELAHRGGGNFRPALDPTIVFRFGPEQPRPETLTVVQAGQTYVARRFGEP